MDLSSEYWYYVCTAFSVLKVLLSMDEYCSLRKLMLISVMPTLFFFSFEDELQTTHLPEMVFGESFLSLEHTQTGIKFHFNALDALKAWKEEALPPVEVPAAAKWKFRRLSITVLPLFTQVLLLSICSERCWVSLASPCFKAVYLVLQFEL